MTPRDNLREKKFNKYFNFIFVPSNLDHIWFSFATSKRFN